MERETELTADNIEEIVESGAQTVLLHKDEEAANKFTIIFNTLAKDPSNSEKEAVNYIYRQLRNADPADDASAREVFQNLFFSDKRYDLGEVGRYRINKKLNLDTDIDVRVLTKEDIIEIIKYLIQLINSSATVDDIDHLSNRRVRTRVDKLNKIFNDLNNIFLSQDTNINISIKIQFLIDTITTYLTQIITLIREEQVLENLTCTCVICRISITQLTIDIVNSFLLRVTWILCQSIEDNSKLVGSFLILMKKNSLRSTLNNLLNIISSKFSLTFHYMCTLRIFPEN
jgi:hypothetical protein